MLVACSVPGRDYPVPVGGIISFWWATSFRYGGRDHLVLVGAFNRNQQRFWWLSDEAFWVRLKGRVESFLAGCVDLVGLTVVDLVWRHQADASMVVILIIPCLSGSLPIT